MVLVLMHRWLFHPLRPPARPHNQFHPHPHLQPHPSLNQNLQRTSLRVQVLTSLSESWVASTFS